MAAIWCLFVCVCGGVGCCPCAGSPPFQGLCVWWVSALTGRFQLLETSSTLHQAASLPPLVREGLHVIERKGGEAGRTRVT